jgi:hypothetical protein
VKPALTHCLKCEYDLAGIPAIVRCPECGTDNLAMIERRDAFTKWSEPRDSALLVLFVLNFCLAAFAFPKLAMLSILLIAVIFVFDAMSIPESLFPLARATKTIALVCGSAAFLFSFIKLIW